MSTTTADGDDLRKKMHDAVSQLVRAGAENDLLLDQLFERVQALEQSHMAQFDTGAGET